MTGAKVGTMTKKNLARRQFIQFLAASPLFVGLHPSSLLAGATSNVAPGVSTSLADTLLKLVTSPEDALDVFDFQRVAEQVLPPAHYGYLATGTDGDETLHANRTAFEKLYLRALRMVDSASIDTRLELLGQELMFPIVIAPVGSQRAFHPEGELATAQAARSTGSPVRRGGSLDRHAGSHGGVSDAGRQYARLELRRGRPRLYAPHRSRRPR